MYIIETSSSSQVSFQFKDGTHFCGGVIIKEGRERGGLKTYRMKGLFRNRDFAGLCPHQREVLSDRGERRHQDCGRGKESPE